MFGITENESNEESKELLREIVGIQEEINTELGFHYKSVHDWTIYNNYVYIHMYTRTYTLPNNVLIKLFVLYVSV